MMYPLTNYHIPIICICWNICLHHKLSWKKLSPTKEKNTEKFEFFFSKSYLGYKFLTVLNIVSKFQEDWIRFEKVIAVYKTLTFGLTKMWMTTESMVVTSRLRDIRRRPDKNYIWHFWVFFTFRKLFLICHNFFIKLYQL